MAWAKTGTLQVPTVGRTPPTGAFMLPEYAATTGNLAAVQNRLCLSYIDVGPQPLTITGLTFTQTTASTGGTAPLFTVGIYDDLNGGRPDFTRLIGSATTATTSAVQKTVPISATLDTGRNWLAFLYTYTAAPLTAPQNAGIATVVGRPFYETTFGSIGRYLYVAGLTALPSSNTQTFVLGADNACPLIGVIGA